MLAPGDRIGDWLVDSAIGEGGMGAVYRAHNALVPNIVAAVKVLKPHSLEGAHERFFREVQAVHRLHHPNIVRVTGFGEDAERGLLWMAMDLIDGYELSDLIHRGPTPAAEAIRLFDGLVDALAHAHGLGVFHRDLKPGNVLVDREGRAKLVDFGIAVQEGMSRLTSTGLVVGTPAYLPPEVFDSDQVDPARADIYAIGQMLHEVLIGHAAFPEDPTLSEGHRMGRLLAAKIKTEALDPGEGFSPQLRALVREATAPEPKDRIASAQALRERMLRLGPETQWLRVSPPTTPAAPTYEPDDAPDVGGHTFGGGFDPAEPGTSKKSAKAGSGRKRGGGRWALAIVGLLAVGGVALVAVAGAAGAAWWVYGQGGEVDSGDTAAVGVDPDTTADPDTAPDPGTAVDPDTTPDPDTEAPPRRSVTDDISKSPAFTAGWEASARVVRKCGSLHERTGSKDAMVDVRVVVDKGRVTKVDVGEAAISAEVRRCLTEAGQAGRYDASTIGTGRVVVPLKGAIVHEALPDPDPPPAAALDQGTVSALVRRNSLARRCMSVLRRELDPAPAVVEVAVQIAADGSVSSAEVQTAEVAALRTGSCLSGAVKGITFPASAEGGRFVVGLEP